MTSLAELQHHRWEIVEMVGVIRGMIRTDLLRIVPVAKAAHTLLCDLCGMVEQHLAKEHLGIYPSLLTHEDREVKDLAWGLINNDKTLKPEFARYKKRWLGDCEFQFSDDFIAETQGVLDLLESRLDLEASSVIPHLQQGQLLSAQL